MTTSFISSESTSLLQVLNILPLEKKSSALYILDALYVNGRQLSWAFKSFLDDPLKAGPFFTPEKIAQLGIKTLFGSEFCFYCFPTAYSVPWESFTKEHVRELQEKIRSVFPEIQRASPTFEQTKTSLIQKIQQLPEGKEFLEQVQSVRIMDDLRCIAMQNWVQNQAIIIEYQSRSEKNSYYYPPIPKEKVTIAEKAYFARYMLYCSTASSFGE